MQGLSVSFIGIGPHLPFVENSCFGLRLGSHHCHAVQPRVEVLVLDVMYPFAKGSGSLVIPCLREGAVDDFETGSSSTHIVLPHVEAQLELSIPEIAKPPFHGTKLTALLTSETLIEHPLLKLSVEDESFCMVLGEELRNLFVLFD